MTGSLSQSRWLLLVDRLALFGYRIGIHIVSSHIPPTLDADDISSLLEKPLYVRRNCRLG
ncbi:MAG: hypothetical protein NZ901_04285 [Geminocystis sp.]|nr:hypothetical protein [Geminocystis sp.]HIK38140.1 hypothetical protein [Geminocystis sp. M7585_C2015_104]MCS7147391.1 hypothetical protein [Geminocystis sp.]MCX8079373.1 hypothetical protein [Geminocystis sp.]MDW8117081.1 hypothetical protein [Geminocystis sp.]